MVWCKDRDRMPEFRIQCGKSRRRMSAGVESRFDVASSNIRIRGSRRNAPIIKQTGFKGTFADEVMEEDKPLRLFDYEYRNSLISRLG